MAAMNKCLAQSNKSPTGDKATKKYEFEVEGIVIRPMRRDPRREPSGFRLGKAKHIDQGAVDHEIRFARHPL